MAAAESPSLLLLKTHLKQKTAKIQEKHQVADVFFFQKAAFFPNYIFFSSLFFLPAYRTKARLWRVWISRDCLGHSVSLTAHQAGPLVQVVT